MNNKDSFLKTVKGIGFQDLDSLDDSDISLLMLEKELGPFFEVFCSLNERNVLTTEEIQEFSSLTPAELAEIEAWEKNSQLCKSDMKHEEKKEALFLQEQLTHIENHNKSIERQLKLFKKHEEYLLEEKNIQQGLLLNARKNFQTYEMTKLPQAEEEFVSNLSLLLEVAQELENLIVHSDDDENKLPTSNFFKGIVQQYMEVEEKVLQCVKTYLQDNFELGEDDTFSFINDENSHRSELIKEASFLQKTLKKGMMDSVLSEKEIKKNESVIKYLEDTKNEELNYPSLQLKFKLEDTVKLNEQLKKREEDLITYVSDAISKHVDALITEVNLSVSKETCNNFNFCVEKIALPMKILLHQRARVEMLTAAVCNQRKELQNLRDLLQKVLNEIKVEKAQLEERKNVIESGIISVSQNEDKSNPETALLSSLYKILTPSDDLDNSGISKVTVTDVVERANKLTEAKNNCAEKLEEKMRIVDLLEKQACSMESLLNCTDKKYLNWHELQQESNVSLNNLNLKLASLGGSLSECNQDLDQKQKILERKGNLRLARNLYIYALTNKELFQKWMEDVKIAVENSAGHKL